MNTFRYRAFDDFGTLREGEIEAKQAADVADILHDQGLSRITIKRTKNFSPGQIFPSETLSARSQALFYRQLSILTETGSIYEALKLLSMQKNDSVMRQILNSLCREVESGHSLSEAMGKQRGNFSPQVSRLINIGEQSGRLQEVLGYLADFTEQEYAAKQKFQTAMLYPTLLGAATFVSFLIVIVFVLPSFTTLFENMQVPLPLPTQILLSIGNFVSEYMVHILVLMVAIATGAIYAYRQEKYGWRMDRRRLKMPLFGTLWQNVAWFHILSAMALMQRSGLRLSESLALAAEVTGNRFLIKFLRNAKEKIEHGSTLAAALDGGFLSPLILQLIDAGEKTGRLEECLQKSASYAELMAVDRLNRLQAMAEPAMIMAVGLFVVVLVLSVVFPILDVMDSVM